MQQFILGMETYFLRAKGYTQASSTLPAFSRVPENKDIMEMINSDNPCPLNI